jgi:hypothetical protein
VNVLVPSHLHMYQQNKAIFFLKLAMRVHSATAGGMHTSIRSDIIRISVDGASCGKKMVDSPERFGMFEHLSFAHVLPFPFTTSFERLDIFPCKCGHTALDSQVPGGEYVHSPQTEHEEHFGRPY